MFVCLLRSAIGYDVVYIGPGRNPHLIENQYKSNCSLFYIIFIHSIVHSLVAVTILSIPSIPSIAVISSVFIATNYLFGKLENRWLFSSAYVGFLYFVVLYPLVLLIRRSIQASASGVFATLFCFFLSSFLQMDKFWYVAGHMWKVFLGAINK